MSVYIDTEMGFLRKPPTGLINSLPVDCSARWELMLGDRHQINAVRIPWRSLSRRWLAIGCLLSEIKVGRLRAYGPTRFCL